jgi:hypothetical protein
MTLPDRRMTLLDRFMTVPDRFMTLPDRFMTLPGTSAAGPYLTRSHLVLAPCFSGRCWSSARPPGISGGSHIFSLA